MAKLTQSDIQGYGVQCSYLCGRCILKRCVKIRYHDGWCACGRWHAFLRWLEMW